jgi:putative ABC transport system permease protein
MDGLRQDLRFAVRSLARSPALTATAVLTLALGISATTTIFSIFEAVLLRSLPFGEPDRIVVPHAYRASTGDRWSVTYADFEDWRAENVFAHVALFQPGQADLIGESEPVRVSTASVTQDFFAALGVRAQLGRVLQVSDYESTAERPLVISHGLWQTQFGGRADIIGTVARVAGSPATIVGVLPARAEWPQGTQLWARMNTNNFGPADLTRRDNFIFSAIARMRPGATLKQTRAQMDAIGQRVAAEYPVERRDGLTMAPMPARDWLLGDTVTRALQVLLAAVALVLLIGCANIANLLLARAAGHRREFAVRSALGSGRARLVRQLLSESVLIGAAGGILGVTTAVWGVRALVALAPDQVFGLEQAGINPLVLAMSAVVSLMAALIFGTAPALHAAGAPPAEALAESTGRTTGSKRARRARAILVTGQLALSIVLLSGAGLLARSFLSVSHLDPGLRTGGLLTASFALPYARYGEDEQRKNFFGTLTQRVESLPGVESATIASALPLGGGGFYLGRVFLAEGRPEPPAGSDVAASWNVVGPDYFRTLDIPLIAGREFDARDETNTTPVIIVNRLFAERMFPGEDPIGKRVRSWRDENLLREIVGVVGDVRYFSASDSLLGLVYVPHPQNTWSSMILLVRTTADPLALTPAIRGVIDQLDPELAAANVRTMDDVREASLAQPRFSALLFATFAVLALLLAAVGVYGMLSFSVAQRTREIGVRVALGAARRDVVRLIARDSAMVIVPGVILGLLGAWASTRLLRALLFEVEPGDPLTLLGVVMVLVVTAVIASALPTGRASRVQPAAILRDG